MEDMKRAIKTNKVYYCLDCGKCTAVCPVSKVNPRFSPRLTVQNTVLDHEERVFKDENLLWSCLSCRMCSERCPSDVHFDYFTRDLRIIAQRDGAGSPCSHSGALQSLMRIMTAPQLSQNRLEWITPDLRVAESGEYLYFVGCLPHYQEFFGYLGLDLLAIARGTIKALNSLGINPVVMADERCCGHDLLWTGEIESFRRLAEYNIQQIANTGAKQIITACAECYRTLNDDFPRYLGKKDYQVWHLSQFLAEKFSQDGWKPKKRVQAITYHDPCRLGRFSGVFEEPRQLLNAIPGIELKEMPRNRHRSLCCGTVAWNNCNSFSKMIQAERLKEARTTGAELLITACPKCQIHFKCAMLNQGIDDELKIEMEDLAVLVAGAL